jgi:hypothetical protein
MFCRSGSTVAVLENEYHFVGYFNFSVLFCSDIDACRHMFHLCELHSETAVLIYFNFTPCGVLTFGMKG